jgi:hypothetical protein
MRVVTMFEVRKAAHSVGYDLATAFWPRAVDLAQPGRVQETR